VGQNIAFWCSQWLLRGGILLLIKFVLEAIPIFHNALAHIPKGTTRRTTYAEVFTEPPQNFYLVAFYREGGWLEVFVEVFLLMFL
jgi:hypothetical protein